MKTLIIAIFLSVSTLLFSNNDILSKIENLNIEKIDIYNFNMNKTSEITSDIKKLIINSIKSKEISPSLSDIEVLKINFVAKNNETLELFMYYSNISNCYYIEYIQKNDSKYLSVDNNLLDLLTSN